MSRYTFSVRSYFILQFFSQTEVKEQLLKNNTQFSNCMIQYNNQDAILDSLHLCGCLKKLIGSGKKKLDSGKHL